MKLFSPRGIILSLALLLTLAWTLSPYLWQIITSLKPSAELAKLPPLLPSEIVFESYRSVFVNQPFARIILNSMVVASSTTLLSLVIGSLAAFSLSKLPIKYKAAWLGLFLSISMFPPIATVSPLYLAIKAAGIRDTYAALIIPYTTFTLPLTIWILTSFFREIPDDLYRSARVDGCTPLQAFRKILLPLAAPGIFTTAILVFIFAWNEFLFALTFTSTERARTIPVGIALFPGMHEVPWGEIAAASVIVTVPLIVLVLVFQRRIISGLTTGAIRG